MIIKAVKFRKDGFYTQPFVFGGEEGAEKFDKNIRYRGSLQNYLIDTGDEVILIDTGIPSGTPEEAPDENSLVYTGKDICTYMEALANLLCIYIINSSRGFNNFVSFFYCVFSV